MILQHSWQFFEYLKISKGITFLEIETGSPEFNQRNRESQCNVIHATFPGRINNNAKEEKPPPTPPLRP